MSRTGGGWIADGRAKAIRADCEASLEALDGIPIDLYLIHTPDPRTPWRTSVRALARLVDEGLVRRIGLANVNRGQLDEALELAPVAAVQVALSVLDDRALRGGVVERCVETGVAVIAHSPLGGPRRAGGLSRRPGWRRSPKPAAPRRPRSRSPGSSTSPRPWSRSPALAARRPHAQPPAPRRSSSTTATEPSSPRARRASPGASKATAHGEGRGHRRRHGHPWRGQEPDRRGVRRARLRPAQPRRAWRNPARARGSARREAVVGSAVGSCSTTRT